MRENGILRIGGAQERHQGDLLPLLELLLLLLLLLLLVPVVAAGAGAGARAGVLAPLREGHGYVRGRAEAGREVSPGGRHWPAIAFYGVAVGGVHEGESREAEESCSP